VIKKNGERKLKLPSHSECIVASRRAMAFSCLKRFAPVQENAILCILIKQKEQKVKSKQYNIKLWTLSTRFANLRPQTCPAIP